jgi:hypothetical protein
MAGNERILANKKCNAILPEDEQVRHGQAFGNPLFSIGSGGGTRTPDTRIMIPLL